MFNHLQSFGAVFFGRIGSNIVTARFAEALGGPGATPVELGHTPDDDDAPTGLDLLVRFERNQALGFQPAASSQFGALELTLTPASPSATDRDLAFEPAGADFVAAAGRGGGLEAEAIGTDTTAPPAGTDGGASGHSAAAWTTPPADDALAAGLGNASVATAGAGVASPAGSGFIINLIPDGTAQTVNAPQSFWDGLNAAVTILEATIQDNITVNIRVGYGEYNGTTISDQNISQGNIAYQGKDGTGIDETYANLLALLGSKAESAADIRAVNALPSGTALNGVSDFTIGSAEAKALGVLSGTDSAIDGIIGMGTGFTGTELIAGALHELAHAMGRVNDANALSLVRYTDTGTHSFSAGLPNPASYFSIDGGVTKLADFGQTSDPSDFLNAPASDLTPEDPFNENVGGTTLTSVDVAMLDVLGFRVVPQSYTISGGQTFSGTTIIYSGDNQFVESGGTLVNLLALNGGVEVVSAGGLDQSATLSSGAEQDVYGSASLVVVNGGRQVVEAGGTTDRTTVHLSGSQIVSSGGTASHTTLSAGGSEIVFGGGTDIETTISAGGLETVLPDGVTASPTIAGAGAVLALDPGVTVSGVITFADSGGQLRIIGSAMPENRIAGFFFGDSIDLASIPFDAGGSVKLVNSASVFNELQITEGGTTYNLMFRASENFSGEYFHIASDGSGGTLVTDTYTPGEIPSVAFTGILGADLNGDSWNHVVINKDSGTIAFTNWTDQRVPQPTDDLLIDYSAQTVVAKGYDYLGSMNQADSLTVAATSRLKVINQLVLGAGLGNDGYALVNNGNITVGDPTVTGGIIQVTGNIVNNNEIVLNLGELAFNGTVSLSGIGRIVLATQPVGTFNSITGADPNSVATLENDSTIEGNGYIGLGPNFGSPLIIHNHSVIDGNNDTGGLVIQTPFSSAADAITNDGMIEATGLGGLLVYDSMLINVGAGGPGTLGAFGPGAVAGDIALTLGGVYLEGGVVATSGSGAVEFALGGNSSFNDTLDGATLGAVTNTGDLVITAGVTVAAFGTLVNEGTLTAHFAVLQIGPAGLELDGGGNIVLAHSDQGYLSGITGSDPALATTLVNIDNTISGMGVIGTGSSSAFSSNFLLNLTNGANGTILADDADPSHPLIVNIDTTNYHVMEAVGAGGLTIATTVMQLPAVSFISAIGVDGVEGVSAADGVKAHVDLTGATIVGGTLKTNDLGIIQTTGSTTLDGSTTVTGPMSPNPVKLAGTLLVNTGTSLTLLGALNNTGTLINQWDVNVGPGDATLSGGGSFVMEKTAYASDYTVITGSDTTTLTTLHNVDNTIAGSGVIGVDGFGLLALDNQKGGTIGATVDDPTAPLVLKNLPVSNAGLIKDTGAAGLVIKGATITQTGAGTIIAKGAGSHVDLVNGTIAGGLLTTLAGGVIQSVAGLNVLDGSSAGPLTNAGTFLNQPGVYLGLQGTIDNLGIISSRESPIDIGLGDVTLTGGGDLVLTYLIGDSNLAEITGSSIDTRTTLHNLSNISGAGWIGNFRGFADSGFKLTLDNEAGGTIEANNPDAALNFNTGATIINAGTIKVDNGASLIDDDALQNNGSLLVDGGRLDLLGAYSGNAIALSGGGSINVETNAAVDIGFGGAGTLLLPDAGKPDGFFGTISGFGNGDTIDLAGLAFDPSFKVLAANSGTDLVTLLVAPNGDIGQTVATAGHLAGQFGNISFLASPDATGGTDITIACFCRGTRISSERGEVPVEDLAIGDGVVTLSGAVKPIQWIGVGRELVTRRNTLTRPIIVRQGALADNVPHRDLYLTHGHALYIDGVLIPVENLINHRSILWDESARVVEYYHIELADHDVLLAEGAPAESYYDANNRAFFQTTRMGSEAAAARPIFAPVLTSGETVERVWAALRERAGGHIETGTTDDPALHLAIDGARLDATANDDGVYTFGLTAPPVDPLRLCSQSAVPSLLGLNRHEHRRLGVAIRQIVLQQPGVLTCFGHDAPALAEGGCHLPEGGHCWTDGELTLQPELFVHLKGPFRLLVHTARLGMRYPVSRKIEQAA